MKIKLNLQSLSTQYFIGLIINIVLLIAVLSSSVAYRGIEITEREMANNTVKYIDVYSYVLPAKAFLESGEFACERIPSYYRTIGYPFFLSAMMTIFGDHWFICTIFVQAIIFAFIYPALSKICMILFPNKPSLVVLTFCAYLFLGAYIVSVPLIHSDVFFAVLFTIGLCFGLMSIIHQKWRYMVLELVFIGCAAQIRPTVFLYAVINIFVLLSIAKKYQISAVPKVKRLIVISSILLMPVCNIPTVRTYLDHGILKPTDTFEILIYDLANNVLEARGEQDLVQAVRKDIDAAENIREKMKLKKEYAISTYKKYPVTTAKSLIVRVVDVLGPGYWPQAMTYFIGRPCSLVDLPFPVMHISCIIRLPINIAFMLFLINLVRAKKFLFLFTIFIFMSYFLGPGIIAGSGSRMRLAVDGIIVMFAVYEMTLIASKVGKIRRHASTST